MYWEHMPHYPSGAWGQALHHPTLDTALLVEVWNSHVRAKLSMQPFFSGTTFLLLHQLECFDCLRGMQEKNWYSFMLFGVYAGMILYIQIMHEVFVFMFNFLRKHAVCAVCVICGWGTMWLNWAVDTIAFASTQLGNTLRVPGAGFGGRDEAPASKVMSTLQSDVCSWWSEQLPLPKLICLKLLSKGTQTGNLHQNYLALAGIFWSVLTCHRNFNLCFYWL